MISLPLVPLKSTITASVYIFAELVVSYGAVSSLYAVHTRLPPLVSLSVKTLVAYKTFILPLSDLRLTSKGLKSCAAHGVDHSYRSLLLSITPLVYRVPWSAPALRL